MTVTLLAQTTLTFVGRDRTGNDYVRLSSVSVYDLDQLWHQIIEYPDTTLVLYVNGTVGVAEMQNFASLQMQNNPNPFDGATDVILCTPYAGDVTMEIADMNGHIVDALRASAIRHAQRPSAIRHAPIPPYPVRPRHLRIDRPPKRPDGFRENGECGEWRKQRD